MRGSGNMRGRCGSSRLASTISRLGRRRRRPVRRSLRMAKSLSHLVALRKMFLLLLSGLRKHFRSLRNLKKCQRSSLYVSLMTRMMKTI
jgi:hypothetical protein